MKILANAKINLSLDITGKREDGYHLIESVMQSVSVSDEIEITENSEKQIRIVTNKGYLPVNEKNTTYKAAKLFAEHIGEDIGVDIKIEKSIPSRAGMGGGSSDAAAVLHVLNKLYNANVPQSELMRIGEKIGADVPFCVIGGTCKCTGIGEIAEEIAPMPICSLVICKPSQGMSTPRAYEIIDKYKIPKEKATPKMIKALESDDIRQVAKALSNRFDEVLRMRQVQEIKRIMKEFGAFGAIMTGSGSAVYGIFESRKLSAKCASKLKKYGEVFLAEPTRGGHEWI